MLLTSLQKKDNAQERSLTVCMMYTINIADIFFAKNKTWWFYVQRIPLIYCGFIVGCKDRTPCKTKMRRVHKQGLGFRQKKGERKGKKDDHSKLDMQKNA